MWPDIIIYSFSCVISQDPVFAALPMKMLLATGYRYLPIAMGSLVVRAYHPTEFGNISVKFEVVCIVYRIAMCI